MSSYQPPKPPYMQGEQPRSPLLTGSTPPGKKKKGGSGCLIALLVVGAFFMLIAAGVGFVMYQAVSSDEGQAVVHMLKTAFDSPGATEMRAAGCEHAMVMDLSKLAALSESSDKLDAAEKAKLEKAANTVVVICNAKGDPKPACDTLAPLYAKATVGSTKQFTVVVSDGEGSPTCARVYEPSGQFIREATAEDQALDLHIER